MSDLFNMVENLTPEQKDKLSRLSPSNINPARAMQLVRELGLDIGEIQKSVKNLKNISKEQKTQKVGVNETCPCGSGKKYKKCCRS